jgi:group I intron endonuclease
MGFIYKITNIITNKCYIGETKEKNPETRWKQHKRTIEKGIGCPALQNAVKKYGIDNFIFKVLIICFDEERFKFEKEYIKKYNSISPNGYNLTSGGEGGGFIGKKHSQETVNKISNTLKNKYINDDELRKNVTEKNKHLMNLKETKEKITNSVLNTERCKSLKENKLSFKDLTVEVSQYTIDGIFINKYNSIKQAEIETCVSAKTISKVINYKQKTSGGFIWKRI